MISKMAKLLNALPEGMMIVKRKAGQWAIIEPMGMHCIVVGSDLAQLLRWAVESVKSELPTIANADCPKPSVRVRDEVER